MCMKKNKTATPKTIKTYRASAKVEDRIARFASGESETMTLEEMFSMLKIEA